MMTPLMVTVKVMIMGAMRLGSTWRKMVPFALAPYASAACRYMFSLMPMTALRAMREPPMPPVMPSTSLVCSRPWPTSDITVIRMSGTMWSSSRKKREPQRLPVCGST